MQQLIDAEALKLRENYCAHTGVVVGDDTSCPKCKRDDLTRDIARLCTRIATEAARRGARSTHEIYLSGETEEEKAVRIVMGGGEL
jgi:hypothetical protein